MASPDFREKLIAGPSRTPWVPDIRGSHELNLQPGATRSWREFAQHVHVAAVIGVRHAANALTSPRQPG